MNMYSAGNTMISPRVKMAMDSTQSMTLVERANPPSPSRNMLKPAASQRFSWRWEILRPIRYCRLITMTALVVTRALMT
ncbi:hypothetical protein D3C76_1622100 [compost metagenome]